MPTSAELQPHIDCCREETITEAPTAPNQGSVTACMTLVGITYRDLDAVIGEVGSMQDEKRSGEMEVGFGGFALNGARAVAPVLPAGSVHVVTVVPWAEYPAVRRALPAGVLLDAVLSDDNPSARLPDSLVLSDPARDRRAILKGRHGLHSQLSPQRTAAGALGARVLAVGRIAPASAHEFLAHSRQQGSVFAWCGGAPLLLELEIECPVLLLDQDEATELTGAAPGGEPLELALALAMRAKVPGAVRVVTGGGCEPTALVWDAGNRWECMEADPVTVAEPKYPKGAGDTFAARFLASAFVGDQQPDREPSLAEALQHARFAAAEYVACGCAPGMGEVQALIANRTEYTESGAHALRAWSVPKPPDRVSLGPVWTSLWRH